MDAQEVTEQVVGFHALRAADRAFLLLSRYIAVMKSNDTVARSARTRLDKISDAAEFGASFGASDDAQEIAA